MPAPVYDGVMALYGGIEAGGTRFVCAVGTGPDDIVAETHFPTTTPDESISSAVEFFARFQEENDEPLTAVGIGTFGPVDTNPDSPTFGSITSTPKPGWQNADFAGTIEHALGVPVSIDTDVNAAILAESLWGAAAGLEDAVYLTIGTGIGGGAVSGGRLIHGLLHPEMGHMLVPRLSGDDFVGVCPFHKDCLEGLASGPAITERWGKAGEDLPDNHEAWHLEAEYLAIALVNLVFILSPERLILGGGVMRQRKLFPLLREAFIRRLSGYLKAPEFAKKIDGFILPPALGEQVGVLGALALASQALESGEDEAW
jgi:fructokinase